MYDLVVILKFCLLVQIRAGILVLRAFLTQFRFQWRAWFPYNLHIYLLSIILSCLATTKREKGSHSLRQHLLFSTTTINKTRSWMAFFSLTWCNSTTVKQTFLFFISLNLFLAILPILSDSDAEERKGESRIQAPEELQGIRKTFS